MYYVYVLRLENNTYYTGYTSDLKERMAQHQRGAVHTTSKSIPQELCFYVALTNKKLALDFEKYLKSSSGHAFRNKHFLNKNHFLTSS